MIESSPINVHPPWSFSTPRPMKRTSPLRVKPKVTTPRITSSQDKTAAIPPAVWLHRTARQSTPKPSKYASAATVHRDTIAQSPKYGAKPKPRLSAVRSGITSEAISAVTPTSPRAPLALARSVKCHTQVSSSRERPKSSTTRVKMTPNSPRPPMLDDDTQSITSTPRRFYSEALTHETTVDKMLEHQLMRCPPPDRMPLNAFSEGFTSPTHPKRTQSVSERLSNLGRSGSVKVKAGLNQLSEWLAPIDDESA
jgi:hypothetical protein